jgi:hypothetical protein
LPIGYEVLEPYYTEAEHLSRFSAEIGPRGRSVPDRHRVR